MGDTSIPRVVPPVVSKTAYVGAGTPLQLPVPPEHPAFAEAVLKVLGSRPSNPMLIAFNEATGVGNLLDGRTPRMKSVSNIVASPGSITCNVTVGEYHGGKERFTPGGPEKTYSVAIEGEALADLLAELKTVAKMNSPTVVFT